MKCRSRRLCNKQRLNNCQKFPHEQAVGDSGEEMGGHLLQLAGLRERDKEEERKLKTDLPFIFRGLKNSFVEASLLLIPACFKH